MGTKSRARCYGISRIQYQADNVLTAPDRGLHIQTAGIYGHFSVPVF